MIRTATKDSLYFLPFAITLLSVLYFHGFSVNSIFSTQLLLSIIIFTALWQIYRNPIKLPITAITITLIALWTWMFISALLSPSGFYSICGFAILSALPITFIIYTLTQNKEVFWYWCQKLLLFAGLFAATTILYQALYSHSHIGFLFPNKNICGTFLNLILFPTMGWFLINKSTQRKFYLAMIFIFSFIIWLINSYGVLLGYWSGLIIIIFALKNICRKKDLMTLGITILLTFLLYKTLAILSLISPYFVTSFMPKFTALNSHFSSRLIIWKASMQLWQHAKWYGIGIYNFYLKYLHYRAFNDSSSGMYVHNDYLQFLIELGLPGLILFLLLMFATLKKFINSYISIKTQPKLEQNDFIETTTLFAGLTACATHSLVSYNFYIMPTLLLFGLLLARFNHLTSANNYNITLAPQKILTNKGYKIIITLLFGLLCAWFIAILVSQQLYSQASKSLQHQQYNVAIKKLRLASQIFDTMPVEASKASVFIGILQKNPKLPAKTQKLLFNNAQQALHKAYQLNPLRYTIPYQTALLYMAAARITPNWQQQMEQELQKTLTLNPYFHLARITYIQLLIKQKHFAKAKQQIKLGMYYAYYNQQLLNQIKVIMRST